jgi:hypothetical protein
MAQKLKFTSEYLRALDALAKSTALKDTWARHDATTRAALEAMLIEKTERVAALEARVMPPIRAAFAEVNGTARAHTLDESTARSMAITAERMLATRQIPLAARARCEIRVRSAGPTAAAYRWTATGTEFTLRRDTTGGWEVTAIRRVTLRPKDRGEETLRLTPAARAATIHAALAGTETITDTQEAAQ